MDVISASGKAVQGQDLRARALEQTTGIQIPALPLISCVTVDKIT